MITEDKIKFGNVCIVGGNEFVLSSHIAKAIDENKGEIVLINNSQIEDKFIYDEDKILNEKLIEFQRGINIKQINNQMNSNIETMFFEDEIINPIDNGRYKCKKLRNMSETDKVCYKKKILKRRKKNKCKKTHR